MLHRYLIAEMLKLRHSLALLLCVAAPSCVALIIVIVALNGAKPPQLDKHAMSAAALWSSAMLPLALTAISVLLAQLEHGPRSWYHLLTLPGARPRVYLAKALMMLTLVAGMSALVWAEILVSGKLIAALRPDTGGSIDAVQLATMLARMTAAIVLASMLQLWVALRFKSFVPPLIFGIAATFIAITGLGAKQGIYFPWLMPVSLLNNPGQQHVALLLGGVGGVVAMLAMLAHLSWREA